VQEETVHCKKRGVELFDREAQEIARTEDGHVLPFYEATMY